MKNNLSNNVALNKRQKPNFKASNTSTFSLTKQLNFHTFHQQPNSKQQHIPQPINHQTAHNQMSK